MLCQAIPSFMVVKKQEQEEEVEESEEEIEDNSSQNSDEEEFESIDESRFTEFLSSPSESFSPSLEQVGVSHELRATDLEQDLSNVAGLEENKKENDNPFKYKVGSDLSEGPKYITSETEIERATAPTRKDIVTLGREQNIFPREIGFSASPTAKIGEEGSSGRYELPDKFDINKAGKDDPFKKQEVKYEPSKEY
jgi:hypothetical protein